jgi:MFS family permease
MSGRSIVTRTIPLEQYSKFRRLAIVHAAMIAGDAAMVVALADSVFLSVDPSAARDKVLLFLVLSFAPFLLLAPLVGPLIDRIPGGRRAVIQAVAACRVVLSVLMASVVDSLALFPLVFAALVLQKTYAVSKSAIVPSVVRTERDLVEANSKLGLIAGLVGAVAVVPAVILQATPLGSSAVLVYAAILFAAALAASTALSADVVARERPTVEEQIPLHSPAVQLGSLVMVLLRASVGFVFFLIAMVLKDTGANLATFGLAVGAGALGAFVGNFLSPRLRARLSEKWMLLGALGLLASVATVTAIAGGTVALVGLSFVANVAAAVGRMGFESILQQEVPETGRGRAFARFETRFQLGWVVGGVIPVVVTMSGQVGALCVALVCAGGIVYTTLLPRVAPGFSLSALSGRATAKVRARRRTATDAPAPE